MNVEYYKRVVLQNMMSQKCLIFQKKQKQRTGESNPKATYLYTYGACM